VTRTNYPTLPIQSVDLRAETNIFAQIKAQTAMQSNYRERTLSGLSGNDEAANIKHSPITSKSGPSDNFKAPNSKINSTSAKQKIHLHNLKLTQARLLKKSPHQS
jgi:hypothetical protein